MNYLAVINTATLRQAMQLAIWAILQDHGDGPNAGQSTSNASIFINSLGNTKG